MLTFSEALVWLKAGEDMRHEDWPPSAYVRYVRKRGTWQLVKATPTGLETYTPTQPEMRGQNWSKA
jgi:hypothetical protein